MSEVLLFRLSAYRHGYTRNDAETVICGNLTKVFEEGPGEIGWRVAFVGFNQEQELLEVIVEYAEDDSEICFHIAKAGKEYRKRYERS